ncbi:MAG: DUF2157 domain-containing protein [Bdellovibrionales bacterium]|nr:DUF2157 domain-containing protein [Bdellovibrionales bacterium]
MFLKTKVHKWLKQGIITPEQAEAILNRERPSYKTPHKSWVLYGFLIIAAVSAGLGILSLVASNWNFIPDAIKLTFYFLLMGFLAFAIIKMKDNPPWFEALLALFLFLCMGGIGLIAQIYNLEGGGWRAFLLWSVITFGLMLFSQKQITTDIWLFVFSFSFFKWAASLDSTYAPVTACQVLYLLFFLLYFFCDKTKFFLSKIKTLTRWSLIMGLIASVYLFFMQFYAPSAKVFYIDNWLLYLLFILILHIMTLALLKIYPYQNKIPIYLWLTGLFANTLVWVSLLSKKIAKDGGQELDPPFVLLFLYTYFLCFVLISLYYYIPTTPIPSFIKRYKHTLVTWTVILGGISLLAFDQIWDGTAYSHPSFFYYLLPIGLLLGAIAYMFYESPYKKIQKILLSTLLALLTVYFTIAVHLPDEENFIKMFFTALILVSTGLFAVSIKNYILFAWAIIFLIIRIFIFYLEKLYSSNLMGISFIILALIIVVFIRLIQKNKDKIALWTKKLE